MKRKQKAFPIRRKATIGLGYRAIQKELPREENYFECCLCGAKITDSTGNDPYPVRPETWYGEKEGRCCPNCNNKIVMPSRILWGRNRVDTEVIKTLNSYDYNELIDCIEKEFDAREKGSTINQNKPEEMVMLGLTPLFN